MPDLATKLLTRPTARPIGAALLALAMQTASPQWLAAQDEARPSAIPAALAHALAAYSAKVAASARFLSGRELASVRAEELAPNSPLQAMMLPLLSIEIDDNAKTVTATLVGQSATATYIRGLGCVLANAQDLAALRTLASTLPDPQPMADPWPGLAVKSPVVPDGVDAAALAEALDYGFTEQRGNPPIRTRAIVVVRRGQLIAERYGEGYDADTPLPGWSMTKSMIAALIGMRIGDGRLQPGANLDVAEWQAEDDPRRSISLDDLLRMQSGLRWSEDYDAPDSTVLRMLFGSSDYAGVAAAEPLDTPPGERFRYSSGTTNVLCRLLRQTFPSDAAYLAYAQRRLFAPLGMQSALIEPDPSGTLAGSSFGYATARDWSRLGLLYLQDGVVDGDRLLPESWIPTSLTPSDCPRRGNYGRHWWLNRGRDEAPAERPFPRLPRDVFYMSGYEGQYVFCLPEQQLVITRLGCSKSKLDVQGLVERVMRACAD